MVGSAIVNALQNWGYSNIITRSHNELDLTNRQAVRSFFEAERPERVYLAAAKVGGIHANNTYPAEFIYKNLMIEANVIHEAWKVGVQKLLFLGSSCIYPKLAPQPMAEDALLTGTLEPTNEPYAMAKIAGIKMCESYNRQYGTDYRSVMPTNLYGPGDNYNLMNSHVIPAIIRKLYLAKLASEQNWVAIEADEGMSGPIPKDIRTQLHNICTLQLNPCANIWGDGTPRREFLHVDDMARACIHVMELNKQAWRAHTQPMSSHINVGTGTDCTIRELAETIARVIGYDGRLTFDTSKPDGSPRKLLDVSRIQRMGWSAQIGLEDGLASTYCAYRTRNLEY